MVGLVTPRENNGCTMRAAISRMVLACSLGAASCSGPIVATRTASTPRSPATATTEDESRATRDHQDFAGSIHLALGIPKDADDSDDIVSDRGAFALSYNPEKNVANWVAWHLSAGDLGEVERGDSFRIDRDLPVGVRSASPDEYTSTGYDRGHLCPSADRTSTRADNRATFSMSNLHPQVPALNRGPWKALETHGRELVVRDHKELYVIAGGVFASQPRTISHGIAVPEAEFKIIVVLDDGRDIDDVTAKTPIVAVIMPNDISVKARPWTAYVTSVDEVERQSGYDFLAALPDELEDELEARVALPPL
jgi:endonuclease G